MFTFSFGSAFADQVAPATQAEALAYADAVEYALNLAGTNYDKDKRKNVFCIYSEPIAHLESLTQVCLCFEVIPAPTVSARGTEQNVYEGSDRKNIVTDNKILKIENVAGSAQGVKIRKNVKTEDTGQCKNYQSKEIYKAGFSSAPAPFIHTEGNYILKYRNYSRKSCKYHKEKEEGSYQSACRERIENLGKYSEDKRRSLIIFT